MSTKRQRRRSSRPASNARHPIAYGWVPDLPDHRDKFYSAPAKLLRNLPTRVDLRPHCPPVYKQGKLHSCTANAIAAAIEFDQMKQKGTDAFRPSRLFIYYNERALERSIASDSGAQIRNGIKTVAKRGACPERSWPYHPPKFRRKPAHRCYREAAKHPAVKYHRVHRRLPHMKACLASGYPFVFGFTVYESFHSETVARTGRAPRPLKRDRVRAGHAVLAVGYDEKQRRFIARNSWGRKWGLKGYFTLPYEYFTNQHLSEDFWTIRVVA